MKDYKFLKFIKFFVLGFAIVSLLVFIVMSLWNWLVPELFNGPSINFWQAGGILLLSKILFWGFGHHGHHNSERKEFWKKKFQEKMCTMSPEDRERLQAKLRSKCGFSENDLN